MPILQRQVQRFSTEVTQKILQEGRVPDALEVALELAKFIRLANGQPTFQPVYQARGRLWDHQTTNKQFDRIAFDIGIAFEEIVERVRTQANRYSLVELSYLAQRHQLQSIINLMRNLLFVSKNAEDNFFGVYDTFDDLSKTNLSLTTRDAVDLNEGAVLLPANDSTANRIDMRHLYDQKVWPIGATPAAVEVVTGQISGMTLDENGVSTTTGTQDITQSVPGTYIQNEPAPNAWFGLAFADMVNAWRQIVTTSNSNGASIDFTVPIVDIDSESHTITQISLTSGATSNMRIRLTHSLDDVNYTKFPGVDEWTTVAVAKTTRIDFEETRCRFVRFEVELQTPTTQSGGGFAYIFGFRNISFHKLGRAQQARYFSRPLLATAMGKPIDKLTLDVTESIPRGCELAYFVAADDGTGNPREGIWRPVQPMSRAPLDGIPQLVKFSESGVRVLDLDPPSPAVVHDTIRSHDYFQLTSTALETVPLFGQAFLYRGSNAWYRNTQRETRIREIRDNFINFSLGDVQNLYVARTETADVVAKTITSGANTVLRVENEIDYNASTMKLKPPSSIDPLVDQRPDYAIYKILRFREEMTVTNEELTLTGTAWSELKNDGLIALGSGRPRITNFDTTVTFTEGIDYVLEESASKLTGKIRRISTSAIESNISSGQVVKVTYQLDPDVTYLAQAITGTDIRLSRDLGDVKDQRFEVTYRFTPKPPLTEASKAMIRVSEKYGSADEGTIYSEGKDYLVDTKKGTITRIPSGGIIGTVFVDFQYREAPRDLDTFSTWVRVDRQDPFIIDINPLDLDIDAGERFVIDGVDISRLTTIPELTFGWHQIVVRSKRPEAFGTAAMIQVAEIYDRAGIPVFVAGGEFFAAMEASRIPMTQKTLTQLTKNTPSEDRNYFAVTNAGHVILNFEPGETEEIYPYGLRLVAGSYVLGSWPEEFRLEFTYALLAADPVEKVLFKAMLSRSRDESAALTPRLYEYHIRLG